MIDTTNTTLNENSLHIINGIDGEKQNNINDKIKCYCSEYKNTEYYSLKEIFSGFNSIKAITFSYDIKFIDQILKWFDYGEIILGGNFLIQKDQNMQKLQAAILTQARLATKAIQKHKSLIEMMKKGNIEFKTPLDIIDHRKIYLLYADDGRTRVVRSSANMSGKAWNNGQLEYYDIDNTYNGYVELEKDFALAWDLAHPITMDAISIKKIEDPIEGNPILKDIKETGNTIILQHADPEINIEAVKYAIESNELRPEYEALVKGTSKKAKNGLYEISPKTLKIITENKKKQDRKKIIINHIEKPYPTLVFDLDNQEAFLNNEKMNLNPSEKEVRKNIGDFLALFGNFDQFVSSNVEQFKAMHFKMINFIFCSPFFAMFRCISSLKNFSASSLPMFALVSSETSNSGKTFMIRAALKMMTGKVLDVKKASEYKKEALKIFQSNGKGIPVFIDEVDNAYISRIKEMIKNPEICENSMSESMPVILFASNNVLNPEEPLRKRMPFFPMDGALPSTVDKTAYDSKGISLLNKLGTGLYQEYIKRMLIATKQEMNKIEYTDELPDSYYPDLMNISSKTILSIFTDFGYSIPSYIKELTWKNDYSSDSRTMNTIREIENFFQENKKACIITKKNFEISLGSDKNSLNLLTSWKNSLPQEVKPVLTSTREYHCLKMDRKELEKILGYKLSKHKFLGK